MISFDQLVRIMPYAKQRADKFIDPLNTAMKEFDISENGLREAASPMRAVSYGMSRNWPQGTPTRAVTTSETCIQAMASNTRAGGLYSLQAVLTTRRVARR